MPRIKKVCTECGSEEVVQDAWVSWDETKQEWVIDHVFEDAFCRDCDEGTHITDEEIKE